MLRVGVTGVWLWVDGLQTHQSHQPTNTLLIHWKANLSREPDCHAPTPIERRGGELSVNQAHESQVGL